MIIFTPNTVIKSTEVNSNFDEILNTFGTWASFTPTFLGATLGNGTVTGKYVKINKTVIGNANFTAGSTSAFGDTMRLTPPVTASSRYTGTERFLDVGNITFLDAGLQVYHGTAFFDVTTSSGNIVFSIYGTAGTYATRTTTSATVPFTMAVGDQINVNFCYESAT